MVLARSGKPQAPNEMRFRTDQFMSKHEIQEYLGKLYRMPFKDQAMPHTSNHMGKVMLNRETRW